MGETGAVVVGERAEFGIEQRGGGAAAVAGDPAAAAVVGADDVPACGDDGAVDVAGAGRSISGHDAVGEGGRAGTAVMHAAAGGRGVGGDGGRQNGEGAGIADAAAIAGAGSVAGDGRVLDRERAGVAHPGGRAGGGVGSDRAACEPCGARVVQPRAGGTSEREAFQGGAGSGGNDDRGRTATGINRQAIRQRCARDAGQSRHRERRSLTALCGGQPDRLAAECWREGDHIRLMHRLERFAQRGEGRGSVAGAVDFIGRGIHPHDARFHRADVTGENEIAIAVGGALEAPLIGGRMMQEFDFRHLEPVGGSAAAHGREGQAIDRPAAAPGEVYRLLTAAGGEGGNVAAGEFQKSLAVARAFQNERRRVAIRIVRRGGEPQGMNRPERVGGTNGQAAGAFANAVRAHCADFRGGEGHAPEAEVIHSADEAASDFDDCRRIEGDGAGVGSGERAVDVEFRGLRRAVVGGGEVDPLVGRGHRPVEVFDAGCRLDFEGPPAINVQIDDVAAERTGGAVAEDIAPCAADDGGIDPCRQGEAWRIERRGPGNINAGGAVGSP